MVQGNIDLVDTAFLQLSFALKLWNFLDVHPIDKDAFDIALTVEDGGARISLPHNEFASYDAVRVASEHNVLICFGVAANTLWEAMREKGDLRTGNLLAWRLARVSNSSWMSSVVFIVSCCPYCLIWERHLGEHAEYPVRLVGLVAQVEMQLGDLLALHLGDPPQPYPQVRRGAPWPRPN